MTPPGQARDDWKILRALSEVAGKTLPYNELADVRDRLHAVAPTLTHYDVVESSPFIKVAGALALAAPTKGEWDMLPYFNSTLVSIIK